MNNSIVLLFFIVIIITLYFFITTRCTETETFADNTIASIPTCLSGGHLIDNNTMCSEQMRNPNASGKCPLEYSLIDGVCKKEKYIPDRTCPDGYSLTRNRMYCKK